MTTVCVLDTSLLGNIFADWDSTGIAILNSIASQNTYVALADEVDNKAASAAWFNSFDAWLASKNISPIITETGEEILDGGDATHGGEKAIVDIVNGNTMRPTALPNR